MDHSDYLERLYTPELFEATVQNTADVVLKFRKKMKFDAIAVRGISGMGVGFPVSYMTDIPLICVRKSSSTNHGRLVEGPPQEVQRYIILDDFIQSGSSIKTIVRNINRDHNSFYYGFKAQCCGIILYSDDIMGLSQDETFELKKGHEVPVIGVQRLNGHEDMFSYID